MCVFFSQPISVNWLWASVCISCSWQQFDYGWSHFGCKHHEDSCEAALICLQMTCGFVVGLVQGVTYSSLRISWHSELITSLLIILATL